jgi:protein-tyrosine phosphatase
METPYPRSWWVIPGKLLAGCTPSEAHLELLVDAGVGGIVCLQEEARYGEVLRAIADERRTRVSLVRIPVPDGHVPSRETMTTALDVIDGFLNHDVPVYVHCAAGHGRTGTVIGCWLVRHHKDGDEALEYLGVLRGERPELKGVPSPETAEQRAMVRTWGEGREEAPPEPAAVSARDPVGTREAVAFVRSRHMTPAAQGEAPDFRFRLGEQRTSRKGELRTIIGYAFDPRGNPRYIVEMAYGNIGSKHAEKAHRQYGRMVGSRLAVLHDLITKSEAEQL